MNSLGGASNSTRERTIVIGQEREARLPLRFAICAAVLCTFAPDIYRSNEKSNPFLRTRDSSLLHCCNEMEAGGGVDYRSKEKIELES